MDTITLNKTDGTTEIVEIVLSFKLEGLNNDDYVIYKNNEKYFAAKYLDDDRETNLITDLSDDEKKAIEMVFNKFHEEGII